jgi:hypothetical protein
LLCYSVCHLNCHSSAQVQHDACSSGDAVLDKSKPISGSSDAAAHVNSSRSYVVHNEPTALDACG